jgi:hypothetical protein
LLVFVVDLMLWCVTLFWLLTLACSAAFLVYFVTRTTFEMLLAVPASEVQRGRAGPARAQVPSMSATARAVVAAVDGNINALLPGADAAAIAGPWGPIDHAVSPETAHQIERVMAVGNGMRDAAGNPCPYPIAPRVALAIVEALHGPK